MTNDLATRNKNLVLHALAEFADGSLDGLRAILHENFIAHAPGNPSGRDAYLAFTAASPVGTARIDIKRVIADDDYVVVHYHLTPRGDDRGLAIIDIWRLIDGLITEHWHAAQPVPESEQVPNGMF
ncbi:putative SnoaL-like aldol condensation-catalyzing enzyme [Nocardia tenerifensis]|uniref:Putative SnoaL-like aldol condensation-catalyzing enzyme n=1 Tax=Nocardia tenerifensis TaxID=228006 RepID=A0A318JSB4_9NOCA|nr:nuclear transport factor 2 family protein [Nocardia tenerifensis]PXX59094.1 putative SnoaL-like aldol condensation-catalyzing enzyme [Nocardia tenerifensis]